MTKQELIEKLQEIAERYNDSEPEVGHIMADGALLEYIGDVDITIVYGTISRWYS